jgi:DNA invertase Pin-like site-specific DNA recombinase
MRHRKTALDAAMPLRRRRCAIYCRVSSEEGLSQEFNSLQAQREACEAYAASQRHEGWLVLPDRYDDGGFSGGTIERPALRRLLRDVQAGQIDIVVVYKVDRLSRSLLDFARIVELFEIRETSFVSITQSFSTTSSMGRLTLNILLSFAQFEREVIGERIRDKVAASKRKGIWMGGMPPLGYDVHDRRLVVNPAEAELIRHIFQRFAELRSGTQLVKELAAAGHRTKSWRTQGGKQRSGRPVSKGTLYKLLNNRVYLGEIVHKGSSYPGEHRAIVPRPLWDRVHAILAENPTARGNTTRARTPALLRGLIRCGTHDCAMGPTFTRKNGRLYRYYLCTHASKHGYDSCPNPSLPAGEVERAVVDQLRCIFRAPEMLARTFRAAQRQQADSLDRLRRESTELDARIRELRDMAARALRVGSADSGLLRQISGNLEAAEQRRLAIDGDLKALDRPITEREMTAAFTRLDPVWDQLFPVEQERIARLLLASVTVGSDGLELQIRSEGIGTVATDLGGRAVA